MMRPITPNRQSRVAALHVDQVLDQFLVQKAHLKLLCCIRPKLKVSLFECVAPLLSHQPPCPEGHRGLLVYWGGRVDTPASLHGFNVGCLASCPGNVMKTCPGRVSDSTKCPLVSHVEIQTCKTPKFCHVEQRDGSLT